MSARVYFMKSVKYCKYQRALLYKQKVLGFIRKTRGRNWVQSEAIYCNLFYNLKRFKDFLSISITKTYVFYVVGH